MSHNNLLMEAVGDVVGGEAERTGGKNHQKSSGLVAGGAGGWC